jgi:hypothetical protein
VSVLLGNGNGTFHSAVNFGVGSTPVSVAVADVNGDGRPDLVTANQTFSGTVNVLLGNRKAATHLQITAPASVTAGTPFTITVKALTADNHVDDLNTGTVTFTSSDGAAVLPADYKFTKTDLGVHTFTVTLNSAGAQTITATDTVKSTITGTASVTVNLASAAPLSPGGRSGGTAPAAASGSVARDLPGLGEAVRARTLAALLAGRSLLDAGPRQHPLADRPTVAGSRTLPADPMVPGMLLARIPSSVAASAGAAGGFRAEEGLGKTGLRLADLEAFFAAAAFVPGAGCPLSTGLELETDCSQDVIRGRNRPGPR